MLSLSSLIQFLLDLLRDPDLAADFSRDPQGTLASNGLTGLTAQDVRDVQPLLADQDGIGLCAPVAAVHHTSRPNHHHDDPVREIHHVQATHTAHHHVSVDHVTTVTYNQQHYEFSYVDNSIHASEGSTVVSDSFNQDNDGVDNKGGRIDDSVVAGRDANGSGNSAQQTVVQDSFDDDHSVVATDSGNETTTVAVTDSGNDESTTIDHSLNTDQSTTVHDSFAGDTVNGSYDVGPLAPVPAGEETALAGAEMAV